MRDDSRLHAPGAGELSPVGQLVDLLAGKFSPAEFQAFIAYYQSTASLKDEMPGMATDGAKVYFAQVVPALARHSVLSDPRFWRDLEVSRPALGRAPDAEIVRKLKADFRASVEPPPEECSSAPPMPVPPVVPEGPRVPDPAPPVAPSANVVRPAPPTPKPWTTGFGRFLRAGRGLAIAIVLVGAVLCVVVLLVRSGLHGRTDGPVDPPDPGPGTPPLPASAPPPQSATSQPVVASTSAAPAADLAPSPAGSPEPEDTVRTAIDKPSVPSAPKPSPAARTSKGETATRSQAPRRGAMASSMATEGKQPDQTEWIEVNPPVEALVRKGEEPRGPVEVDALVRESVDADVAQLTKAGTLIALASQVDLLLGKRQMDNNPLLGGTIDERVQVLVPAPAGLSLEQCEQVSSLLARVQVNVSKRNEALCKDCLDEFPLHGEVCQDRYRWKEVGCVRDELVGCYDYLQPAFHSPGAP